jgi:hypothetical protein
VELPTLLDRGLELPRGLPATLAFDYPTIEAITGFLLKEMFGAPAPTANGSAKAEAGAGAGALAGVAELTDEEAEALLLAELDEMRSMKP